MRTRERTAGLIKKAGKRIPHSSATTHGEIEEAVDTSKKNEVRSKRRQPPVKHLEEKAVC